METRYQLPFLEDSAYAGYCAKFLTYIISFSSLTIVIKINELRLR